MPASVPERATRALAEAALPYVRRLATHGMLQALREDAGLRAGTLLLDGAVTHAGIAKEAGLPFSPLP